MWRAQPFPPARVRAAIHSAPGSASVGAEHHIADRTLRLLEYDAHTHAFKPETLIELPLTATLAELQQEVTAFPRPIRGPVPHVSTS